MLILALRVTNDAYIGATAVVGITVLSPLHATAVLRLRVLPDIETEYLKTVQSPTGEVS